MAGIRVAGLWEKTAPNGEKYYEGTWGPCTIRVYSNKYKKSERDPECVVYLNEKPKDEKGKFSNTPAKAAMFGKSTPPPVPAKPRVAPPQSPPSQDEVPWPDPNEEIPY